VEGTFVTTPHLGVFDIQMAELPIVFAIPLGRFHNPTSLGLSRFTMAYSSHVAQTRRKLAFTHTKAHVTITRQPHCHDQLLEACEYALFSAQ